MEKTGQWERVKELFHAALEHGPDDRDRFLNVTCGDDTSLRAEIESLLSAYGRSGELSQPLFSTETSADVQPLQFIGPYRLIRKIGEGGMGQVWLAEQTEPLHRQVALKLIRAGMFDDAVLHRFQTERQSLAMMDHPTIAKVFDAGTTADGQPYFVMEYVQGEPITEYCDRRKLTVRERLELFVRVCEGVQHAHQKAIIHRDLKPANILVVEVDGIPIPRIIDFGVAKTKVAGTELCTQAGAFVGTPGYMSPEQLDSGGEDVDTRTDVYSLGVVLYELLSGSPPFDNTQLRKQPLHEVLRRLRTEDPPLPSTNAAGAPGTTSELRQTAPRQLVASLKGDLDSIAMKAIESERRQRYGTPSELAADIGRFLHNEPVLARPQNTGYRLTKYMRRHRVGVTVAAGLILLLVAFVLVQAIQLRRIARERDRAGRITDYMVQMFKVSDPSEARGNQVTAREILDKASTGIETGLSRDPNLQTHMMMVMGTVYENLGLYGKAESLYRQAKDIRTRELGPENSKTLNSQVSLAWALYSTGHYRDAEDLLRQALAIQIRRFGLNNAQTIRVKGNLGAVLNEEGHPAEAEKLERDVLQFRRHTLGDKNPDTLVTINNLALTLEKQGHWNEAENLFREQLAGWRQLQGEDSPRVLAASDNLAIVLYREGRLAEAEKLERKTLGTKRRVLGPDHPETVRSMNTLVAVLTDEGKLAEAQGLAEETLAIRSRVLGRDHPLTLTSMSNLAEILTRRGHYDEAEKLLNDAKAAQIRVLGPNHPGTALTTYNLACLELRRGRTTQALQLLREAVDHGLEHWIAVAMPKDPDLKALQGDPRFISLLDYASKHGTAASGSN